MPAIDDLVIGEKFTVNAGEDLVFRRPVTGSTPCTTTEIAAATVDGTTSGNSKWCSDAAAEWLLVDLGRVASVKRFIVRHAGAGGEWAGFNTPSFTISTSTDCVTWTAVVSVASNVDSVTWHEVAVSARYVRLEVAS